MLQLEEIDTSPKNDQVSEGDEEEEGAKEGRDNSDEEKHQVELKKTQWVARLQTVAYVLHMLSCFFGYNTWM